MTVVKKHFDTTFEGGDRFTLDMHYWECQRCGWKSDLVRSPGGALDAAARDHDNMKCLNPQTEGAA